MLFSSQYPFKHVAFAETGHLAFQLVDSAVRSTISTLTGASTGTRGQRGQGNKAGAEVSSGHGSVSVNLITSCRCHREP